MLLKAYGLKGGLILGTAMTVLTQDFHLTFGTVNSSGIEMHIVRELQRTFTAQEIRALHPDTNQLPRVVWVS